MVDREVAMQAFGLVWVTVGVFLSYMLLKIQKEGEITLAGCVKKVFVALALWGIVVAGGVICAQLGAPVIDWANVPHSSIVIPLMLYGAAGEVPLGGWLQQKVEAYLKK